MVTYDTEFTEETYYGQCAKCKATEKQEALDKAWTK